MINRIVLAAVVAAFGVTAVVAQSDPIAARKALMKENGAQSRIAREMIEGKQPFNLAAAKKPWRPSRTRRPRCRACSRITRRPVAIPRRFR